MILETQSLHFSDVNFQKYIRKSKKYLRMDFEQAEARKKKLRDLELSLFGKSDKNVSCCIINISQA